MLTQQFFTRVQLAKILNFKSDGSIKDLEKKGFISPQIKPAKYTFNQVLFMMICKEIVDCTDLSWKYLIEVNLNCILQKNLIDNDLLRLTYYKSTKILDVSLIIDHYNNIVPKLYEYLDSGLSHIAANLKESENTTNDDKPTFYSAYNKNKNCIFLLFSIDRVYQKLQHKCIELEIDLKEKVRV